MAKRFTDTAKWDDKWFRCLSPTHKLAWLYLCDRCDAAGVIELDTELADFQIGAKVDWGGFFTIAKDRIEPLAKGKHWVLGFIVFQYGGPPSGECKAHAPVLASLEKHGIKERVFKGYPMGIHTHKEKEKEKDKDKDKDKGRGDARGEPFKPPTLEDVEAYVAERGRGMDAQAFWDFYESKGWRVGNQKMRDWRAAVRNWERGDRRNGPAAKVLYTLEDLK